MHAGAFVPSLPWALPFAALLLAIAVLPLAAPHFWESNLPQARAWPRSWEPGARPLLVGPSGGARPRRARDYVSFIVLLGGLFVISGGVFLEGDLEATPRTNTAFLGLGALLASFVGTTGASMLLIRPLLQTNRERKHVVHTVVFFIFLVSNIGGCLTPLGDPPLFLGYLPGVPFTWTFRLFVPWLFTTAARARPSTSLWDRREHAREALAGPEARLLRGAAAAARGQGEPRPARRRARRGGLPGRPLAGARDRGPAVRRCPTRRTDPELRKANRFTFHPILEVAALFAGIFVTMMPALDLLRGPRRASWACASPGSSSGRPATLSSFLDNAPTYLTFLALGAGPRACPAEVVGVPHAILVAISLGAVFMGANTYIGNGPNFMVRAIAEERGVKMPSFGGYMLYSAGSPAPGLRAGDAGVLLALLAPAGERRSEEIWPPGWLFLRKAFGESPRGGPSGTLEGATIPGTGGAETPKPQPCFL